MPLTTPHRLDVSASPIDPPASLRIASNEPTDASQRLRDAQHALSTAADDPARALALSQMAEAESVLARKGIDAGDAQAAGDHARQAVDHGERALALLGSAARPTEPAGARIQAHRSLWLAHKSLDQPAAALQHCEALLALLGGPDAPLAPGAGASAKGEDATLPPALLGLLDQARQRRKPLALAALEVRQAAMLRERHGARIGDAVEREVANLLRQRLRSRDLALPWLQRGWLIALVDTPPAAAVAICDRLRAAVQQHDWAYVSAGLDVKLDLGLVTDAAEGAPGGVLQRAQAALRQAQ